MQRATCIMFFTSNAARDEKGFPRRRIQRTSWADALINESPERTSPTFPHISRRSELRSFSGSSRSAGRPCSSSSIDGNGTDSAKCPA
jgi:hypothetical protein